MKLTKWTPSGAIRASAVLHAGAAIGLVTGIPWQFAMGAIVANHAALTLAGLWPRSTVLGLNLRTLSSNACLASQVSITIDDGPNPSVTPAVLDILDTANAKASFFCIGRAVKAYPDLAREIVLRGHGIENHSFSHHHHFSFMGMRSLHDEISKAQDCIAQCTGYAPVFFRAPAGLRSPLLDPVLQDLNLSLVSWTRRGFDTVQKNPEVILNRLETRLAPGDILLLHDGNCAATSSGKPVVLEVLPALLASIQNKGLHSVPLHLAA